MSVSDKVLKLAGSNNHFTYDLFKKIATETSGNIFFSPFSINVALSMTFAGARGSTADEMRGTLKIEHSSDDDFHSSFKDFLAPILQNKDSNIAFHIGNRMYVQGNFPIQDAFQKILEEHYLTTAASVDFAQKTEAARMEINGWVEEQTKQKIKDLIPPDVLNALTRMVLVNAVYFKGDWKKKFNPAITHPGEFFLEADKKVTVDMMFQKGRFPYAWSEKFKCSVAELPYVNDRFSMVLVLPNKIDGLKELEEKVDAGSLRKLVESMKPAQVEITLPKFNMNGEMCLSSKLSDLGMPSLFTANADLSGITGNRELYVSAVLHKAFLEVNEEGSEAAAATAVVINTRCAFMGPQFNVDHPFLLMIRAVESGTILFMGRVADPSKS